MIGVPSPSGSSDERKRGGGTRLARSRVKRSDITLRAAMPNIAPIIRPLDEAAALEWLRSQPGRRTNLPAAELGRRWGWQRQRASRRLKAWQKAGLISRRGNVVTVADALRKPVSTWLRT